MPIHLHQRPAGARRAGVQPLVAPVMPPAPARRRVGPRSASSSHGRTGAGGRPRIALMLVLVAAAMPVRIPVSVPLINSVSVLDILLFAAAATLLLDRAFHPLDVGYRRLFALLCVPLVVCALSLLWSQDRAATVRATVVYAEGVIAYLFVQRELAGVPPGRVITYVKRYTYLVIIPAGLMLLHAPGFGPEEPGLSHTSGGYLSYYTRLSHPVLGRSNSLATVLAFFIPLLLYWGHRQRDRRFTVAGIVALVAVAFTLSRGVALALLVVGLLAALGGSLRSHRVDSRAFGKALAIGSLTIAGVALLHQANPYTRQFFDTRFSFANVTIRSDYVSDAFGKIVNRPVLGYGGGVTPDHDPNLSLGVHDTYLQQMVYFGPLLGLVVSASLVGIAAFFFSRSGRSPVARAAGYALVAQLLIFIVESSFEGTVLRVLFYLSVGLAAALTRSAEAEAAPAAAAPAPSGHGTEPRPGPGPGRTP